MKRKKKYSYVLLELLIAFFLLTIFLIPLVGSPLKRLEKEKKELLLLHLQIKGKNLLIGIEEALRKQEITWDLIEESQKVKICVQKKEPFTVLNEPLFPLVEAEVFLTKTVLSPQKNGTILAKTHAIVEFYERKKKKKLYRTQATFFLAKKHLTPENP